VPSPTVSLTTTLLHSYYYYFNFTEEKLEVWKLPKVRKVGQDFELRSSNSWTLLFFLVILRFKLRASDMLGRHSTI
jgi:hypothetical protein